MSASTVVHPPEPGHCDGVSCPRWPLPRVGDTARVRSSRRVCAVATDLPVPAPGPPASSRALALLVVAVVTFVVVCGLWLLGQHAAGSTGQPAPRGVLARDEPVRGGASALR